ncbi:hypothetical protein QQ045_014804 [Rhodiola kirilowii]
MYEDGQRQQQFLNLKQNQMEDDRERQLRDFNLKQMEENTGIMQMNTNIMTPTLKRYFSKRKAAILHQYEEEEDNNDQALFGDMPIGDLSNDRQRLVTIELFN